MAFTAASTPQPLGQVLVASAGTPVQITSTLQTVAAGSGYIVNSSTDKVSCNKINIIASPLTHSNAGNTGNLYFGFSGLSRSTLVGVIAVIPPNGSFSIVTNVNLNEYDANQFYVDADNNSDGFYGSIDTI